MKAFAAFWVDAYCPHLKTRTRHLVSCERKGKYHVTCLFCGHGQWVAKELVDVLEKTVVPTLKVTA